MHKTAARRARAAREAHGNPPPFGIPGVRTTAL